MLDDAGLTDPVLFIYRNNAAVVLGKNQNPWREAAVSRLDELGVKLARRVSGGGTVFHDQGNINVSCIVPRDRYDRCAMLRTWIAGLAAAGIKATVVGNTSLAVDGLKVSGAAFCYRRDKVLHHGTLLWETDLKLLHAALVPDLPGIRTRAVPSAPMPVGNLRSITNSPSPQEVIKAMESVISDAWGGRIVGTYDALLHAGLNERAERMRSKQWLLNATPDFECEIDGAVVAGHRGIIQAAQHERLRMWVGRSFEALLVATA